MVKKTMLLLVVAAGLFLTACGQNETLPEMEEDIQPSPETITLIVGPALVKCVGEAEQDCMQVKRSPEGEWEFFYDHIEGFDYQPGFQYELTVAVHQVENPPMGGSSLRYVLVEVVEKTEEVMEKEQAQPAPFEEIFWVLTGYGDSGALTLPLEGPQVSLTYKLGEGMISGSAGCNNYFGEAVIDQEQGTITTGPLGATRKMCQENVMTQEYAFLEMLGRVFRFEIEVETLTLSTPEGEVLVFQPGAPME